MHVGVVRMAVRHRHMGMLMGVRFDAVPTGGVFMLMMLVMPVAVAVHEWFMRVFVLMALAHMKPHARCHQGEAIQNKRPGEAGHRAKDRMTPNKGATEKEAPGQAVPSPRRATTNSTRLKP